MTRTAALLSITTLLCMNASAAITVSKSTLNFSKRGSLEFPQKRAEFPLKTVIQVGGSPGAWTVALAGTLNTACGQPCLIIDGEFNGTPIASGTGNATVAYDWLQQGENSLSAGAYSGTVTFTETGTGLTASTVINLIENPATSIYSTGEVKYTSNGPNTSCSVMTLPTNVYTYSGVCPIPNLAPSSNLPDFNRPAVGGSFTDPVFGGVMHRITGPGCVTEYGTVTPYSANSTYIFTSCGIYNNFTGAQLRDSSVYPSSVNIINVLMSPTNDHALYYYNGAQIRKWDFVAGLTTTLVGDFSAAPYNVTTITAGGTADLGDQGWFGFYEQPGGSLPNPAMVFAVNIPQLEIDGAPANTNTYYTSIAGPVSPGYSVLTRIDWMGASDVDDVTGKHYVVIQGQPVSMFYSVGPANYGLGTLSYEFTAPEVPNSVFSNNGDNLIQTGETNWYSQNWAHSAMYKGWDGQIQMFSTYEDSAQGVPWFSFERVSAGILMFRPREEGGGLIYSGAKFQDMQPGCSSRVHFCGLGNDPAGNFFFSLPSGNPVVSGSTVVINLATSATSPGTAAPWPTSGTVQVLAANATNTPNAWSCLNGIWTATVSNAGATVTLAGAGTACTGVSGAINSQFLIGDASVDAPTYFGSPYQDLNTEILWKPGKQIHKVAQHRGRSWINSGGSGGGAPISQYNTQIKAGLSRDGRYQVVNTNWGSLDYTGSSDVNTSVFSVLTGIGPSNITGVALQPAETNALLSYSVSTGSSCTIEVSASSNFQTILRTITDAAGAISRQTPLGTLTAATNYWWRMQCGVEVEASVYPFTTITSGTPATQSINTGVGAPTVTGVTKVVLEHQADVSTGAWTAVASVPCATAGSGCVVAWDADIGHVNWERLRFQDSGSTDLFITQPTAVNVSR